MLALQKGGSDLNTFVCIKGSREESSRQIQNLSDELLKSAQCLPRWLFMFLMVNIYVYHTVELSHEYEKYGRFFLLKTEHVGLL